VRARDTEAATTSTDRGERRYPQRGKSPRLGGIAADRLSAQSAAKIPRSAESASTAAFS
jgi:hypothetical protein